MDSTESGHFKKDLISPHMILDEKFHEVEDCDGWIIQRWLQLNLLSHVLCCTGCDLPTPPSGVGV